MATKAELEQEINRLKQKNKELKKSVDSLMEEVKRMKSLAENNGSKYKKYEHMFIRLKDELKKVDEYERKSK